MDTGRFDRLTRTFSLVLSRRGLAGASGLLAIDIPGLAEAKKKNRKKKKIKRNEFGCVNVGKFCKNAEQCCSRICQGKRGKKTCKAHDTGGCQPGEDTCADVDVACTTGTGDPLGECFRTTGNASYCANSGECFPCTKDADCVPFCGPQAACSICAECEDSVGAPTACLGPSAGDCEFV